MELEVGFREGELTAAGRSGAEILRGLDLGFELGGHLDAGTLVEAPEFVELRSDFDGIPLDERNAGGILLVHPR